MTAPIIGITTGRHISDRGDPTVSIPESYVKAILRAGGVPVLIPVGLPDDRLQALRPHLQGLLFSGGGDIDPEHFNGDPHPRVYGIDPARDEQEFILARQVVHEGLPFLGICRGIQLLNVALGGSLYTHVADQRPGPLRHANIPGEPRDRIAHQVLVEPGSTLARITGARQLEVNSLHHQGLKELAPGLVATAQATDGLVESVELPGHRFGVAVQWHPEWMPEHDVMQAIFRAFVRAAGEGAA